MSRKYQEEWFSKKLIEELAPLTELSWLEANCSPDTEYDPDWERYTELNELGILRLFTARDSVGELIGYLTFIVGPTLHSRNCVQALHDSFYILRNHRRNGTAMGLIKYAENEFKNDGISMMIMTVMLHKDYSYTLTHLGFTKTEMTFIKRMS